GTGARLRELVLVTQQQAQDLEIGRVIVDDQDSLACPFQLSLASRATSPPTEAPCGRSVSHSGPCPLRSAGVIDRPHRRLALRRPRRLATRPLRNPGVRRRCRAARKSRCEPPGKPRTRSTTRRPAPPQPATFEDRRCRNGTCLATVSRAMAGIRRFDV